ncbi:MAG: Amino acid transporter permease [Devosia sp.]|nr:Amino acid transporter permease [Devosia sp.]
MSLLFEYRVFLIAGFVQTLLMALVVALGGTTWGIILTAGIRSPWAWLRTLSNALMELFRDVPLMVTVLLAYFVLPMAGIGLDPFWSTCVAISAWGGANAAQIFRAGLISIGKAQRETAAAFGMTGLRGLILIVLPQAMPVIIPPYVGLLTALVQATSLGAVVGAGELLRSGQILIEQTTIMKGGSPAYVVYGTILVVYFVLCRLISMAGTQVEKSFLKPYARTPGRTEIVDKAQDVASTVPTSA